MDDQELRQWCLSMATQNAMPHGATLDELLADAERIYDWVRRLNVK